LADQFALVAGVVAESIEESGFLENDRACLAVVQPQGIALAFVPVSDRFIHAAERLFDMAARTFASSGDCGDAGRGDAGHVEMGLVELFQLTPGLLLAHFQDHAALGNVSRGRGGRRVAGEGGEAGDRRQNRKRPQENSLVGILVSHDSCW